MAWSQLCRNPVYSTCISEDLWWKRITGVYLYTHTHTHTHIHTHHTFTVPILLLLLHLLPIVLGEPDENCTRMEHGKPLVPRIGCAAESCLRCNDVDTECVHNGTSNTFTCTANTTTCSVELCPPCNFCVGTYIQPLGNSGFRHHSLCAFISSAETCEDAGANKQCVVSKDVSSESDVFTPSSDNSVLFLCHCYGENCTEHLLYSYSILPQPSPTVLLQSSPNVLQSVAMRTSSLSVTPTPEIDRDSKSSSVWSPKNES